MTDQSNWIGLTHAEAIRRIIEETGRDSIDAESLFRNLLAVHPGLRSAVRNWLCIGEVDREQQIEGWSIRRLIEGCFCRHVSEAFTWLDGLIKNPEYTLNILRTPRHGLNLVPLKKGDGH